VLKSAVKKFCRLRIIENVKISKSSKFRAPQTVKIAVYDLLKSAKIVFLKIRVATKFLNFHTVE